MADTFYFSHDYNARSDEKIKSLIRKHGMLGVGIFWSIIEDLYQNANAMRTDYECIAYDLRTDVDVVKSVINDFDLFVFEGDSFGSLSIQNRLIKRDEKSRKASESAHKRWNNANAMRTHTERNAENENRNAIKERKVKDIKSKVNKKKEIQIHGDGFLLVWNKWLLYKKEEHKETYKTTSTEQAAFDKLYALSGGDSAMADKIILQSITNQWKGIFPIKNDTNFSSNQQLSKRDREQQIFEQLGSSIIGG